MKKAIILAVAVLAAGAAAADPVEGTWKTEPDDGAYAHIRMAPCGPRICGTIVRTFDADGAFSSPNLGKTLVIDMEARDGGAYEGKVWRPSNNRIYLGKIELNGDALDLRGCVAGGLLCSRQTWTRVE